MVVPSLRAETVNPIRAKMRFDDGGMIEAESLTIAVLLAEKSQDYERLLHGGDLTKPIQSSPFLNQVRLRVRAFAKTRSLLSLRARIRAKGRLIKPRRKLAILRSYARSSKF